MMDEYALRNISYGVYIVSTWDGKRPTGCTVNCVMQITAIPATMAVSINHDNFTKQCIEKSGKFAITILGEKSDPSIIGRFGFQSGKDINKFDSVEYDVLGEMPILKQGCAYVTCEVINSMETETHTVFLGKVIEAELISDDEVMTYQYYHNVIKGRSPKNAPTYIANEGNEVKNQKTEKYVCSVCKYEYQGEIPFEDLPDDYVCPICKQPKSVFKKQ